MSPRLSICIPTFDRKEWLRGCIRAIQREIKDLPVGLVEIVVSNNASSDGTMAYLDAIAGPGIVVHHNTSNNHLTNFWTVCQYATGDYIWLMGDDDEPLPGAIQKVLNAVGSESDWYFPERLSIEHANRTRSEIELYSTSPQYWDLRQEGGFVAWANSVHSEAGIGGLLSVLIGRRKALLDGFLETSAWGNDTKFPHLAAFMHSNRLWPKVEVIPGATVLFREYNDGVGKNDPWYRIMIDLRAWISLADHEIHEDAERDAFFGILRRHHGFRMLPTLSMMRDETHPWEDAENALRAVGYSEDAIAVARNILVRLQRVA